MDTEYLYTELAEITECLMVLHNHDPSNDTVEECYVRLKTLRDKIEEELEWV